MKISDEVKNQIQISRIILSMLLAGQILFYLFTWYIIRNSAVLFNEKHADSLMYLSLPFVVFGMFFGARYIGKKRKEKLKKLTHELARAEFYRETVIMQGALIEMGSLYFIFVAFFTFSLIPYLFFAAGVLVFLFFFPTEEKYLNYLEES